MNKTVIYMAVMATISCGAAARAQDPSQAMIVSAPGLSLQVGAAVKDDLLAGTEKFAQGASKVTEINLNPSTMEMMGRTYGPGGDLTKKMKLMVVHTYAYDKPGMYRMEDVDTYVKKLQDGSWNCPIVSREKDKDQERLSYICTKAGADQSNEMVILTAEPQKLTFIHMAGTMSLNDLSQMSGNARNIGRDMEPHGKFMVVQPHVKVGPMPAMPPTPAVPPTPPAQ